MGEDHEPQFVKSSNKAQLKITKIVRWVLGCEPINHHAESETSP